MTPTVPKRGRARIEALIAAHEEFAKDRRPAKMHDARLNQAKADTFKLALKILDEAA